MTAAYHVLFIAVGWLATSTVVGGPVAAILAIYVWDTATWPDRVEQFRIARGDRMWRSTPEQRALADLAATDASHTVFDAAALPPAAPVERDPLTQPELAHEVSLHHRSTR